MAVFVYQTRRDTLFPLFNPPYGYDYNTALLLFAAWFGYHRLDLEVSVNGRRVQQHEIVELVGKGSKDFFQAIAISDLVSLKRRVVPDKAEIKRRIQEAGKNQFNLDDAKNEIVWLRETADDERHDPDLRKSAQQTADNLNQATELAIQYNREASQLKEQIGRASTAKELMALQKKIASLPIASNVQTQEDTPELLRQQIEQRFTAVVEAVCQQNESPKHLTQVGLNRANLMNERKAIANAGLPTLMQRIEQSLVRLKQREKELETALQEEQREQSLLAIITSVDSRDRLQQLLSGKETLAGLSDLSDKLAAQRDERLQQIEKEIAHIRSQITQSRREIEQATQAVQLQPTRDRLLALQSRCADTAEAEEIAANLADIEDVRGRLVTEAERHAALNQTIRRVKEQATLAELTQGMRDLRELTDLPEDMAQLRDSRVKALEKAVAVIRAQIEQAENTVEGGQTTGQLNKVQETLYMLKTRCAETPEAEKVEELLARLEVRREQLAQVERHAADIRRAIEAADPKASLKRLNEARQQLADLNDIPADLAKMRDQRLDELEKAIEAIRSQIDRAHADLKGTQNRNVIDKTRDNLLQLQTRCTDMPEEDQIAQLIAQTDQLKAELEEQEHLKNEWRETIRSVSSKYHRLRQLLDGQATLQALPPLPDDLSREQAKHLRGIEKAIATLEQQVERAGQALDAITTPSQLQKQRDELVALKQRCEETPLEVVLVQHIERADDLTIFFTQFENERNPQIDSPTASNDQIRRLEQLSQGLHLTSIQRTLVVDRQEQIKKAARGQREKAQNWLAKQELAYQNNNSPTELAKQLENPPLEVISFLSIAEMQQLTKLRQQVEQQIDADLLTAIESRFRQIRERRLQEQCLQALRQILDATQDQ